MLVINPGSVHSNLDMSDFIGASTVVGTISNNPAPLS